MPMCARTQEIGRSTQGKIIALCFAKHQVACQNSANGGRSEWRPMHECERVHSNSCFFRCRWNLHSTRNQRCPDRL